MGKLNNGRFIVLDMYGDRASPGKVEQAMRALASQDGRKCTVGLFQDPGSAGVKEKESTVKLLAGYPQKWITAASTKGKETFAKPLSAQAEAGNVLLLRGHWNDSFLSELESFPDGNHDDQVDTASGAFHVLTGKRKQATNSIPFKSGAGKNEWRI